MISRDAKSFLSAKNQMDQTRLFVYLSEILGHKVLDSRGRVVGKLYDLLMHVNDEVFPRVEGLIVRKGLFQKEFALISWTDVQPEQMIFRLKIDGQTIAFQREPVLGEFSLRRHILDRQVVDTNDQKVVRVNDVHLLKVDQQLYLAHVDVGPRGLIRRLGWSGFIDACLRWLAPHSPFLRQEELLSWKNTHVLTVGRGSSVLRSDITRKKLAKIPTMDLADIMEDLNVFEKLSLFKIFTPDMQRKIFTDMTLQQKEELIDHLTDKESGNLIENIPADEATDLLNHLPQGKAFQLMRSMTPDVSRRLRMLLGFARNSAGGLMTTEYLSVGEGSLVRDAIQKIKDNVDYPGNIVSIYVVDQHNQFLGATSLRRFLNAEAQMPLIETCYPKKVFVRTDDSMEEVALLLEKYKLSSIPVLNDEGILQGVVTSDDVMEELISLAWKKYKDQL